MPNFFLYLTAFFCGMSVMAVEITASRLLAPYYGTSQVMWTVIIGLILIALSVGNILGGRAADKRESHDWIYGRIFFAALWIGAVPFVGKLVVIATPALFMWIMPGQLLIAGSVFSSLVLFAVPLIILGMVSPYLVKLAVKDMATNGKVTGTISACSTIGSILGTFIPTFVTVPTIGTSRTFLVFALVLVLVCVTYFIFSRVTAGKSFKRTVTAAVILFVLLVAPLPYSFAFWTKSITETESPYNYLRLSEEGENIVFSTSVAFTVQSVYTKDHALTGQYFDYLLLGPFFFTPKFDTPVDALVLGLGTGTFAKECKYHFPKSRIDGVEIDAGVVELGQKYCDLSDKEVTVHINDGRTFLGSKKAREYDLIVIDAYRDISIPFHMCTREFFGEVKERLKPHGVVMINVNMRSRREDKAQFIDYLTGTLQRAFGKVYRYDYPGGMNSLVVASDSEWALEDYRRNVTGVSASHPLYYTALDLGNGLQEAKRSGLVLTDEVAPVELMAQGMLDEIVGDTAREVKGYLLGRSPKELLEWILGN